MTSYLNYLIEITPQFSLQAASCSADLIVRSSNTNVLILLQYYGNRIQPDVSLTQVLEAKTEMPHQ